MIKIDISKYRDLEHALKMFKKKISEMEGAKEWKELDEEDRKHFGCEDLIGAEIEEHTDIDEQDEQISVFEGKVPETPTDAERAHHELRNQDGAGGFEHEGAL